MNKKWYLMMTSILLAAMVSVGCNNADPDPAPPEDDTGVEENGANNDANDIIEGEENVPGVDENDTMNKDDENDADPDPEDPIEDAEDMGDNNNKDE
ncbi:MULTISPECIES: hypothetical protein [Metabacillus]|uniref:DNA primase n=2 Tax=Metabacillus TaxID=2675233 RepID=A0A179SQF7_9BACI|nr:MULTISPECIES: hypothetical protein [Metabacillus]OAS82532.1 hypothetical protein A6K24_12865 [Metabacillus litoralis]QNF26718.1 hypothetical protein HUW50_03675 [Metabacillus sp. KUDC1714]